VKVCFAVEKEEGLDSVVCGHFHCAPMIVIVDTESGNIVGLENKDLNHVRGSCDPVLALVGNHVDVVVVHGMGIPAMMRLFAQGIEIYSAVAGTIGQNLELVKHGRLHPLSLKDGCCGFQGQGCKRDQVCVGRSTCGGDSCGSS
jgi:predicted Fe-Mo cluster-binding NifX family protein